MMIATAILAAALATAPVPAAPSQSDDIVVVARQSGAPVWQVRRGERRIVLVGAIEEVSKDTRWSPRSLEIALAKANRLTFPDTQDVDISLGAAFGFALKWRRQERLPAGISLAAIVSPADRTRLDVLQRRGLLPADYLTRHPFHLAVMLRDRTKGRGFGPDASKVARRIAKRNRIAIVPLGRIGVRPLIDEYFRQPPAVHVPCLMAAAAVAEAGPQSVRARSDAWAEQRVADSLGSVAEGVHRACWPSGSAYDITPAKGLAMAIGRLIVQPGETVGVVSLAALGAPGGVLDQLAADGFVIEGPRWK